MKKNLYIPVVLVLVLVLGACTIPPQPDDPKCPTGVTMSTVNVTDNSDSGKSLGYISAFIARPNQGCNLPVQYCIFVKSGFGGGLSCTTISP